MSGQSGFQQFSRRNTEHDVRSEVRFPAKQVTNHISTQHLFMHGIGFDMLGEKKCARRWSAQPFHCLAYPSRAGHTGDFGNREVPDHGTTQPAMQAEHRHHVHDGECRSGHIIQIIQIGWRQPGGGHEIGVATAIPVVELQCPAVRTVSGAMSVPVQRNAP